MSPSTTSLGIKAWRTIRKKKAARKAVIIRRKNRAKRKIRRLWSMINNGPPFKLYSESDTRTKFIMPLLQALGWNIYDINEVREGGYLDRSDVRKGLPDCILYVKEKPYIMFEIKRIGYGTVDKYNIVQNLLRKARRLKVKYAVLTRFCDLKIYNPINGKKILDIEGQRDWEEKFHQLWTLLSKPS